MNGLDFADSSVLVLRLDGGLRVRFLVDLVDKRVKLTTEDEAELVGEVVGVSQGRPRCNLFGRFVGSLNSQRGEIREAAQRLYDEAQQGLLT